MSLTHRQQNILDIITEQEKISISGIKERLGETVSTPTLNRDLSALVTGNYILKLEKGRSTSYKISPYYILLAPLKYEAYFEKDPDTRNARTGFNHNLLTILKDTNLFTNKEKSTLEALKQEYKDNISNYPKALYQKEMERLTIELSWKSSQIEGNTYSLLETERLFLEKKEAEGKQKTESIMLLNHKDALDYVLGNNKITKTVNLSLLEEIHSLLVKDLGVGRNIRTRTVGITGTAYTPLDNEFQIKEATQDMCALINEKRDGIEKALLAVALISYIQPFEDGNKRTSRMISNALLIETGFCPLSYRSVDSLDYKKAMLLFYEQNNLAAFKEIFMEQIEFSVKNYFR